MSTCTYVPARRRYVIRQLSNLAKRARRIRLSKNGTPKIARPEDIAHAVVFLSSDRLAGHITGQTLVVAGGMEGRMLWQPHEIDPALA